MEVEVIGPPGCCNVSVEIVPREIHTEWLDFVGVYYFLTAEVTNKRCRFNRWEWTTIHVDGSGGERRYNDSSVSNPATSADGCPAMYHAETSGGGVYDVRPENVKCIIDFHPSEFLLYNNRIEGSPLFVKADLLTYGEWIR